MIRVERAKKLKTTVSFYRNSFGMRPPHMVLCDGNFLFAALDRGIDLQDSLTRVFRGQVYLKLPGCILAEVRGLGGPQFARLQAFAREKCQKFHCAHQPRNPFQCVVDTLRRGFAGAVATQDQRLRRVIHRDYPAIPVFFIAQHLQISPPPKSLRSRVQAELTQKYASKQEEPEPPPLPDDEEEDRD
jgi:rRNA-processing protein FCF1